MTEVRRAVCSRAVGLTALLRCVSIWFVALAASATAAVPVEAVAECPFLHPLFTDHMVLQRDILAPVWGWTDPGLKVTVAMSGKTATAVADAGGRWQAKIGPFAAGGPFTLTVSGPQSVTVNDVLLGDVWICSGQSNMEWPVASAINGQEEIANQQGIFH